MKIIKIALISFLFPLLSIAQQSLLYNDKGEFRSNLKFAISKTQYEIWQRAEIKILSQLSPHIVTNLENEVAENKILERNIFSFDIDSNGVGNVSQVYNMETDQNEGAIRQIQKHSKEIAMEFNDANKKYFKNSLLFCGTYYICM